MNFQIFALLVIPVIAFARPEYAAQTYTVSCVSCHVNPYGGGARIVEGKLYGSRDFRPATFSKQNLFSVDVRGQDYIAMRNPPASSQSKGQMLMNVIPTADLPLSSEQDGPLGPKLILSYNFATAGAFSMREGYLLLRFSQASEPSWLSSLLVGNFMAPFGLMTDEHRTYTKQMVSMTNRNFESGLMLNGDPSYKSHYDFALTSGFANAGSGVDSVADSWATFLNFRFQPSILPAHIGVSYALEGTSSSAYNITATSIYGVFSTDRYAKLMKGNIQFEYVMARGWNNSLYKANLDGVASYFIPSTASAWQTALNDSSSMGFVTLANWDLNHHWTLQVKYEQFTPDSSYSADNFIRGGVGFKYYFGSNMNLIARYDHGVVNRPGLTTTDLNSIKAIGDTYAALLHVWL